MRLAKIAIGNGAFESYATFLHVPVVRIHLLEKLFIILTRFTTNQVTLIETYPHLVSYDTEVLAYFRDQ